MDQIPKAKRLAQTYPVFWMRSTEAYLHVSWAARREDLLEDQDDAVSMEKREFVHLNEVPSFGSSSFFVGSLSFFLV